MASGAAVAQSFGKYALVAKLAIGGMAEIFLARLVGAGGFEKLVVIKRILPHLAKDQHLVEMFLAEARIAAQISHPNVCQVFELGEIEGRYFIAMEYLEGVPLACFRRRDIYGTHPDFRLVAGLGVQACEGLHHAHNLKRADGTPLEVVHRDVSGNNLFATIEGTVKVLDFGIAKIQDASVRTSTGSVKGTYAYMAPEQLRGERLDRRTDVFALGIVLWELFARRHLFKRETEFLTFQAITTDPIQNIGELRPDVPAEMLAAIMKALSRDREQRFPNARAFGEALAAAVMPYGGPWTAAMISDEIARSFETRLDGQRELIKVARAGGAVDLDDELGPSIGHGTDFLTTPLSMVSNASIPGVPKPGPVRPSAPIAVPTYAPTRDSAPIAVDSAPSRPLAPARSQRGLVLGLALLATAGIAAAVVLYLRSGDRKAGNESVAVMQPSSSDSAGAPSRVDAATLAPSAPVDAAAEPADASVAVAVIDAADVSPTVDAAVVIERRPTRPDRSPTRPTGPPGFITIDASPVYAIVFIDGKRYGETPLVRLELAPGKHTVRAVSPSGTSRNFSITIEPGKVAPTKRIEW